MTEESEVLLEIAVVGVSAGASAAASFYLTRNHERSKHDIYEANAKAKAKVIEHEATLLLKDAKYKLKEKEVELKEQFDNELLRLKDDFARKKSRLEREKNAIEAKLQDADYEKSVAQNESRRLKALRAELENMKQNYQNKLQECIDVLQNHTSLTQEEIRAQLRDKVEQDYKAYTSALVRRYEKKAQQEAKKNANYILAQATSRYAGEFAAERLINVVNLPNDELKGRIIGKEGRNIKTLEMLLGVDVIIDDTPGVVILSSFNLYRRAVATKTLELLLEDGRIQPARIEEIHQRVQEEFEQKIYDEGEEIVLDLGVGRMHKELTKLIGKLKYRASYGQNALGHSLEVAHLAGIMAAEMGGDEKMAKRAGLLHDIGKALTHEYEGTHVDLGAEVCRRYGEGEVVLNAIYAHHGHEEASSVESFAVCSADSLSAARPGARREVLESFLKRVKEIENIAMEKEGVIQCYAIDGGRELRVFANAVLIDDNQSSVLAKEISQQIESGVQYPGEIKVTVIRETRAVDYAK
ncbi:MAG: ribonuclease Y [Campylobacterota bacterium]